MVISVERGGARGGELLRLICHIGQVKEHVRVLRYRQSQTSPRHVEHVRSPLLRLSPSSWVKMELSHSTALRIMVAPPSLASSSHSSSSPSASSGPHKYAGKKMRRLLSCQCSCCPAGWRRCGEEDAGEDLAESKWIQTLIRSFSSRYRLFVPALHSSNIVATANALLDAPTNACDIPFQCSQTCEPLCTD